MFDVGQSKQIYGVKQSNKTDQHDSVVITQFINIKTSKMETDTEMLAIYKAMVKRI